VTRRALSFGAFAAVSLLLTAYIAAQIAHVRVGSSRYSLVASFDDVMNLGAGDPVRLAGVPVGQVTSVHARMGKAEVRFAVDRSVRLADDSQVGVRWLNLIGQRELSITPGTAARRLHDGDRVRRANSVVDLGALINELGPLTESLDPAQVNQLVEALVAAFDGNRAGVDSVIGDLGAVVQTLATRKDTIAQLVSDYATITDTVARRDGEIATMVDNLATLSSAFAGSQQVLDQALVQLPRLTTGLDAVLGANATDLGHSVDDLAQVTGTVHAHLGDLEQSIVGLTPALKGLFTLTSFGQFGAVNLVCISAAKPPCPHPILTTGTPGAGQLRSPSSFHDLLLGNG
jgi:phospholipid/cholesterol/gamma-HCH transport system substrate-binding protein